MKIGRGKVYKMLAHFGALLWVNAGRVVSSVEKK